MYVDTCTLELLFSHIWILFGYYFDVLQWCCTFGCDAPMCKGLLRHPAKVMGCNVATGKTIHDYVFAPNEEFFDCLSESEPETKDVISVPPHFSPDEKLDYLAELTGMILHEHALFVCHLLFMFYNWRSCSLQQVILGTDCFSTLGLSGHSNLGPICHCTMKPPQAKPCPTLVLAWL